MQEGLAVFLQGVPGPPVAIDIRVIKLRLRVGAVGTASGSACGSVGSEVAGAVDMERTIEEAHKGQGHYAVGSRWHEPVLRAMMTKLGSPSLEWRYGDG